MAKAVRFKVRCTICHEVFQNDYVRKHTKYKHKDLHGTGRLALVTMEVDQSDICQGKMDAFFAQFLMTASPKVQRSERYPQTLRLQNCPSQKKVMNGLLIKVRQALKW